MNNINSRCLFVKQDTGKNDDFVTVDTSTRELVFDDGFYLFFFNFYRNDISGGQYQIEPTCQGNILSTTSVTQCPQSFVFLNGQQIRGIIAMPIWAKAGTNDRMYWQLRTTAGLAFTNVLARLMIIKLT